MTLLERAARALAEHHALKIQRAGTDLPPDAFADAHWRDFLDDAQIVVEAIREPSLAQLKKLDLYARYVNAQFDVAPDDVWRLMIDGALEEG